MKLTKTTKFPELKAKKQHGVCEQCGDIKILDKNLMCRQCAIEYRHFMSH